MSLIYSNYRLPKRVADLDLQESDSEDDKNDRFDNFNSLFSCITIILFFVTD